MFRWCEWGIRLTLNRKTHLSVELWSLESACYWKAQLRLKSEPWQEWQEKSEMKNKGEVPEKVERSPEGWNGLQRVEAESAEKLVASRMLVVESAENINRGKVVKRAEKVAARRWQMLTEPSRSFVILRLASIWRDEFSLDLKGVVVYT